MKFPIPQAWGGVGGWKENIKMLTIDIAQTLATENTSFKTATKISPSASETPAVHSKSFVFSVSDQSMT